VNEPATSPDAAPAADVSQLVEHLFRHEAGKIVATLTRIFGIEHLQLAEDVFQEALTKALQTWPYYGIPKNPSAWLMQVARNLALDVVRRDKVFRDKETQIVALMEPESGGEISAKFEQEIKDDHLRMMFVCCHPLIPAEAQVALALRTLCGFGTEEISRAFLTSDAAIAKRLTRARQRIREAKIPFEIPPDVSERLDGVLHTLYLLFSEGYKASTGDKLIREELCHEAIRLGTLLAEHSVGNQPRTHALLALMLFNGSRLRARQDASGNILRLQDQDRGAWDQEMIVRGMKHLGQSATGEGISEYHLQAAIAACHASAKNYESTDWEQILRLYDSLIERDDSPIVQLNRAVALAQVHGPKEGLRALAPLQKSKELSSYYLLYAVLAEFESELGNFEAASEHLRSALELVEIKSEHAFLLKKLQRCQEHLGPGKGAGRNH
jgi:RNA polymerase sigma-70 factor (ECF subfamily)